MGWKVPAEVITAVVAAMVLLALVLVLGMFVRRRVLSRSGGVFDCAANLRPAQRRGHSVGMARYAGDRLEWYRIFSVAVAPTLVVPRRGTRLTANRPMRAGEDTLPGLDTLLSLEVPTRQGMRAIELALDRQSATGFMSWLEAAPPGV